MSCVHNVVSVSGLFVFIPCLVYTMLSVSKDCLSASRVLCTQCCQRLSIVYLRPVSCGPSVVSVSELFIFVLCLVYSVLSVSLDCLSSSCVLCAQCCQCLWIVYIRPVTCVHNVVSVSGLCVFILCFVYPMLSVSKDCLSSSRVLCTLCCQCLWIVCLRPESCVPYVVFVSGLFVFVLSLVYPMFSLSLDCLSSPCVLCNQCSPCIWIVCLYHVSCVQCDACLWIVCLRIMS